MIGSTRMSWPFRMTCLTMGLATFLVGEWAARALLLETRVARIEAPRSQDGRYVVNETQILEDAPSSTTVILYGDSSNDSVPERDSDKRYISEMLRDELAPRGVAVGGISFPGNAVDWVSSHLRYLVRAFPTPDHVVVPLNLRWISPGWRGLKNTATDRRIYELQATGPFRWILGAKVAYSGPPPGYDPRRQPIETVIGPVDVNRARLSRSDYEAAHGGTPEDYRREIGSLRMGLSYGLVLDEHDPFFVEIDRIADTCRAKEIRCLFYLPPFNFALAAELTPLVADTLAANLRAVRAFAASRGYRLLDLSESLPPENFHDHYNEHVDEVGRRLIAICVARAVTAPDHPGESTERTLRCHEDGAGNFTVAAEPAVD